MVSKGMKEKGNTDGKFLKDATSNILVIFQLLKLVTNQTQKIEDLEVSLRSIHSDLRSLRAKHEIQKDYLFNLELELETTKSLVTSTERKLNKAKVGTLSFTFLASDSSSQPTTSATLPSSPHSNQLPHHGSHNALSNPLLDSHHVLQPSESSSNNESIPSSRILDVSKKEILLWESKHKTLSQDLEIASDLAQSRLEEIESFKEERSHLVEEKDQLRLQVSRSIFVMRGGSKERRYLIFWTKKKLI